MLAEKGAAIVSHLGQLEAAVMECLWAHDEAMPVREVLTELNGSRELAYTTVMTVLDNLHRKGMVARGKAGRAWEYTSVGSRSSYTAELMEEALVGNPDRGAALLRFVEKLPADELAQLRQLLDPNGSEPGVTSHSPASETTRQP